MAEYINMIVVSSVLATLFLGGWTLGGLAGIPGLPFVWFLAKVAIFLFIFIWIRATLPRIRYDQLMRFGWQVLLPLAVLNLLVTAAVVTENWSPWILTIWGFGALIVGTIVMLLRRKARVPAVPQGTLTLPVSVRLVSLDNPAEQSPAPVS
jgi:NADH-quinone oxidoreductase subunit H